MIIAPLGSADYRQREALSLYQHGFRPQVYGAPKHASSGSGITLTPLAIPAH
jgi:hypothetical protein